ncbi:MAG: hypothetical protein L0H84_23455 [Pseudonocardia sp.]|nr:hypothetical protein [Pseudonocardia sp.]
MLTTREHKPVNRHYFIARIWKPALAAHGIPTTRDNGCHALRHYYANVLLDGGESIKTVSERLGHADRASRCAPTPTCSRTATPAPAASSTPYCNLPP